MVTPYGSTFHGRGKGNLQGKMSTQQLCFFAYYEKKVFNTIANPLGFTIQSNYMHMECERQNRWPDNKTDR